MVELANLPETSKAIAVEVCNAREGAYELVVSEESTGEYFLSVRASASAGAVNSRTLDLMGQEARICHYHFTYEITDGKAVVRWLDGAGSGGVPAGQDSCAVNALDDGSDR